jgi:hypothetical protein
VEYEPVLLSTLPILDDKPLVVVATEPDKLSILEDNELDRSNVVVATDEDNEPIELDKFEVVVAIDELNEPTLDEAEDVYELKDDVKVYEGANDAVSADATEPDMFIPPVAVILPVTTTSPSDINPFLILN